MVGILYVAWEEVHVHRGTHEPPSPCALTNNNATKMDFPLAKILGLPGPGPKIDPMHMFEFE
jgi:hypothetical protein